MDKVLVVEDDEVQQRILAGLLARLGFQTVPARSLAEARAALEGADLPRLIVLDRGLPDGEGLDLCRALKRDKRTRSLPILVLTSRTGFEEELQALREGADLFVPKPPDLQRLQGYIRILVARTPYRGEKPEVLRFGAWELEPESRSVRYEGRNSSALTEGLFELLYILASGQGRAIPRRILWVRLWGAHVHQKQVDVAVSRLRTALGAPLSAKIRSLRGTGYILDP